MKNTVNNRSYKFSSANFKKSGPYFYYIDGSILYRNSQAKLSLDKLDTLDKWLHVLDMYKDVPNVYDVLKHLMKRTTAIDMEKSQIIDITEMDSQPMIIILRAKNDPDKKLICFAYRTYFGKIDSRTHNLTACIPMTYSPQEHEPLLSLELFYISQKPLPLRSGRYSINHGGVWFNFKMNTDYVVEAVISYFDMVEALRQPQTIYHACYPQDKNRYAD